MIRGERVELRREGCTAAVTQLVGVQPHGQIQFSSLAKYPANLARVEGDGLAESIDAVSKCVFGDGR